MKPPLSSGSVSIQLSPMLPTRLHRWARWISSVLLAFLPLSSRAADALLDVTPGMLSGSLTFFASPAGLTFNDPIPYGINNNISDSGWIWPSDNSGVLQVDFGSPTDVRKFRVFSSYNGGSRGATWAIEHSADGATWTLAVNFDFVTDNGAGVDDDGVPVDGSGGWYETRFNDEGIGARFWRVRQTQVLVTHAPRVAQVEFYGATLGVTVKSTFPEGRGVRGTETIRVELQNGTVVAVAPEQVQLIVNEQSVTPVITPEPGSNVSWVRYEPPQPFPEGPNTAQIIFPTTLDPLVWLTNTFQFEVANEAASALVLNLDFNGARNDPGPDVPGPTFIGVGPAGGGNVWNGIEADSREGEFGDNDQLTVSGSQLLTSLGDPTSVGFTITPVGGDVEVAVTNPRLAPSLFGDLIFVGFAAQTSLTSDFTISGLGDSPYVDLYFYSPIGEVGIENAPRTLIPLEGFFSRANTHYFPRVPVIQGEVKGTFSGDPGKLAGLTITRPAPRPWVKSQRPGPGNASRNAVIEVALENYVTQVAESTVQLRVNGQPVQPTITQPAGGTATQVTYTPAAPFEVGRNTYQLIFGDGTTTWTNDFTFNAVPDEQIVVTADMVSGPLNFFASPAGLFLTEPIPYGVDRNTSDFGWIWPSDNSGFVTFDLKTQTPLSRFRVFASAPAAPRGALWAIEYSDDAENWLPVTDFLFETKIGAGVNDDGSPRADTAGWYEISFNERGSETHRYWRVRQSEVTVNHAPRASEIQLFRALPLPSVKSLSPVGRNINPAEGILIELQDNITAVRENSIQLFLNGQPVTPVISKPAGSLLTTISYDPPGDLPSGDNTIRLIFANDASPSESQTIESSFSVQGGLLSVSPAQLSGPLNFLASPAGLTFAAPIPYGIPNNVEDSGWIWPPDNTGSLTVDFGVPAIVQGFRAFASYGGASRGAVWTIEYSSDLITWLPAADFTYQTSAGGGVNDDGTARTDFGGWYGTGPINAGAVAARYWRVRQTAVTVNHAPRTAQVQFSGSLVEPVALSSPMLSGSLAFFASPAGLDFGDPVPYGIPNNVDDLGWIWPQDNTGELLVSLPAPQALNLFRVYCSYPGAPRGALWIIESSEDAATWNPVAEFPYETRLGGGVNADGTPRTDFGGWYSSAPFNPDHLAASYWRVRQDSVLVQEGQQFNHAPRSAQIEFYSIGNVLVPEPLFLVSIADEGSDIVISWTGEGTLQSAATLSGEWSPVPDGGSSPVRIVDPTGTRFYRLIK
ncbi:MAG: hypothetical protein KIT22_05380 [Verrucomicrobiae bacterium]|nr:hypothetical protein [Verrucomicrobiae bacterium]